MDQRRYNQYCALAVALDHLGDRWTLLVIRELLLGPKRYSDLRVGLPGIATNLLAKRLRSLEGDGIVARHRLPPPAASTIYELTELGRGLEPAMLELMRWGSHWMGTPPEGTIVRASWLALALKAMLRPERLAGVRADFELQSDGETIHLRVGDGDLEVLAAPGPNVDVRLTASPATVLAIAAGTSSLDQEVAAGRARVEGSPQAVQLFARTLTFD